MKRIYRYSAILILLLLFASCKKMHVVSEGQKVLFQVDYINYSSGYVHNGFIIDNEGNVLTYEKPEKWHFPDKNNFLFQHEIVENMLSCKPSGKRIPESELKKYVNYINNIAASKVSARKTRTRGNRTGTTSYYCFQYSESESEYKVVTIKTEGEIECENLNFFSRRVVEWLKEINNSINK